MTEYEKLLKEFGEYEKSKYLDRMFPTFIIPNYMVEYFIKSCKPLLSDGSELHISWNIAKESFVCILTRYVWNKKK